MAWCFSRVAGAVLVCGVGVGRAWVDRHVGGAGPPGCRLLIQPGGGGGAGAVLDLGERPSGSGGVDESGVPLVRVQHPANQSGSWAQTGLRWGAWWFTGRERPCPRKVAGGRERRCSPALRPLQSPGLARRCHQLDDNAERVGKNIGCRRRQPQRCSAGIQGDSGRTLDTP
jgi:hypothetical protein